MQGALADAIEQITGGAGRGHRLRGGRTRAFTPRGQVASLELAAPIEPERLLRALNGVLPREVGVLAVALAEPGFDALRDARGKRYRYRIWNARPRSPLRAGRFAHVPQPLDLEAMRAAAQRLEGEHDFRSFQAAGSDAATTVRDLRRLVVEGAPGGEVAIVAEGSGFLRYMVRNLVGTLIEVGLGRRDAASMPALLAAVDRREAGPTAPAHGLTLEWVDYGEARADAARAPGCRAQPDGQSADIPEENRRLRTPGEP